MLKTLYKSFQHWSLKGSVYLYSDPHFTDEEMKWLRPNYIGDDEQIARINKRVHRNDTLIILGDIGDETLIKQIKAGYKVLVTGNHDSGISIYEPYFNEVYDGPVFIANKLVLSHEPLDIDYAYNLHGHIHDINHINDEYHLCLSAESIDYTPIDLKSIIQTGALNKIDSIHRKTIEEQKMRKAARSQATLNS